MIDGNENIFPKDEESSARMQNKLRAWESLLLDTGKRNNLVNFKSTRRSTVDILAPNFATLFSKAEHSAEFEVFGVKETANFEAESVVNAYLPPTKEEFISLYADKLKKKQILVYNDLGQPLQALKNIRQKAQTAIEETGINIAYMAFGFVHWAEKENPTHVLRAPVLLVPVSIDNPSPLSPYYIKVTDDVLVNPAFSFKLKHEYGIGLPDFDEDEGLDGYWNKLSDVLSKLHWWVDKDCKIGLFSFQKMNMYEDLKENAEQVLKNKNVRALFGEMDGDLENERVHGIDILQLCNVVDVDSSQAEAIALAKAGESFVLQGPPGTGKSQTITNVIAECIGDGKSVLFVSEKLAALNVVYDKLKRAGLEEFCLELHSHKANKRQVIDEFYQTLRKPKSRVADSAEKIVRSKGESAQSLDEYTQELHLVRPEIQKSLYQLFSLYAQYHNAPNVDFVIQNLAAKGEEHIEKAEITLTHYAEFSKIIGADYRQHPWYGYLPQNTDYQTVAILKSDLSTTTAYIRKLEELCQKAATMYGLNANSVQHAHALGKLFTLAKDSRFITPALFSVERTERAIALGKSLRVLAEDLLARKAKIEEGFFEEVYRLDGRTLHKELTRTFAGFFSRIFNKEYGGILRSIRFCKKDGKKPKYEEAVQIALAVGEYQAKVEEFLALQAQADGCFGDAYNGVNTDFARLLAELDIMLEICRSGVSFGRLARMGAEEFSLNRATFMDLAGAFDSAAYLGGEAEYRLVTAFDCLEYNPRTVALSELKEKYEACKQHIGELENWREFQMNLRALDNLDLRGFIHQTIEDGIASADVCNTYCKMFYRQWADKVLNAVPALTHLTRLLHDNAVRNFKEKDELHLEINKAQIRETLSKKRPDLSMVAQGSAISVLLREAEKKRKKKSIRDLLAEIGELAQTLKPCFLMSPLSVSTYLSPNASFDVVIFDEASQIFPQDAVGAIYRGKQLIVVGDSKQMPPSNFFTTTLELDEDEEQEDVVDFESVLDLCAASFPQRRLKWHYRSKFEPLIAFSNKNFYDNDLLTFPSAKAQGEGLGVEFIYAGGTFDRKSKTNRVEAELITDMVFEHFEKYPARSLGVVAFSVAQQNLIERLIYKRRKELTNFEAFFSGGKEEPFFVKNLETVQGDERDVIIFSVAYGKDAQGKLLMNFGPINREGGERRLNVAFTRAKYNIKLVASMRAADMDISGSKSEGVRLLRAYLDYAEKGQVALDRVANTSCIDERKLYIEEEISRVLEENGYAVDKQVGYSEYPVDLAVKHPNSPDYVLAIECDGVHYHAAKTTRDRDRLRPSVLKNMGWQFYRIWSVDWFKNPEEEKKRLLAAVENAIISAPLRMDSGLSINRASAVKNVSFDEVVEEKSFAFPTYERADDMMIISHCGGSLSQAIKGLVEKESPISEEWVLKRLISLFDRKQLTVAVWREYEAKLKNFRWKIVRKEGFLYKEGGNSCMLRVPAEGDEPRELKYIELQELANGLRALLAQNVTVEKNSLFKLLAQQLGFARVGDLAQERMEAALALLDDELERNDDFLSLK